MRLTVIEKGAIGGVTILVLVLAGGCGIGSRGTISDQRVEQIRQQLIAPTSMYVHDYEGGLPPNAAALYPYHKSDQLANDLEKLDKAGYRIEFSRSGATGGLLPPVNVTISRPQ